MLVGAFATTTHSALAGPRPRPGDGDVEDDHEQVREHHHEHDRRPLETGEPGDERDDGEEDRLDDESRPEHPPAHGALGLRLFALAVVGGRRLGRRGLVVGLAR